MKTGIHPAWNHQAKVTCSCGATFVTGSMQDTITVDICSKCHPFFTGEMRFVDRQGRVDRFKQKVDQAKARKAAAQAKVTTKKADEKKKDEAAANPVLSYKQMLQLEQNKIKQLKKAADQATK